MADPVVYDPAYSFTGFQASAPADPLPADKLDIELADIKTTTDSLIAAVEDVRRSDGALKNAIVTLDSLAPEVLAGVGAGAAASTAATAADVLLTHADVLLTHADVDLTHADVVATGLDKSAAAASAALAGTYAASFTNGMVIQGEWDASTGVFPGAGVTSIGWFWNVSVAGVVDGVQFDAGDSIAALAVNASTVTYAGNWLRGQGAISAADVTAALGYTPATAAQGALADSAVQPAALAAVATSGAYSDLTGAPTIWLPEGHLFGLGVSNNATANYFDIAVGSCRSADNGASLTLAAALTKRMDTAWAAGTNAGGFAAGEALPVAGTVHVWLISTAAGVTDVMANNHATSGLTPALPATYVYKRRIASWLTTASTLWTMKQWGNFFFPATAVQDFAGGLAAAPGTLVALSVPLGLKVRPLFRFNTNTTSMGVIVSSPDEEVSVNPQIYTGFASAPGFDYAAVGATNLNFGAFVSNGSYITNVLGQLCFTGNNAAIYLTSRGWIDDLGRNG